jgi:acyl dehydratase
MPLSSTTVGVSGEPVVHEIDARWMMAYAAGLGETLPCYLDTRRPAGIVTHPLFPVCVEWPALLAMRGPRINPVLTVDEALRSVHATHDLVIHRGVRPGDCLTTRATIVGVERRKPGAYQVTRLDTVDAAGAPVCTTWQGGLYRGVEVDGPEQPAAGAPPSPTPLAGDTPVRAEVPVPISALAAHIYTECARIWNPIHTDLAVAVRAGLPDLILHGTATLALAVSQVLRLEANNDPTQVRRVTGRFNAMVRLPSEISVRICTRQATAEGNMIRFEVRNIDGELAVRDGLVLLGA